MLVLPESSEILAALLQSMLTACSETGQGDKAGRSCLFLDESFQHDRGYVRGRLIHGLLHGQFQIGTRRLATVTLALQS